MKFNNLLLSLVLSLLFCGIWGNSKATHIMGSDITWQTLGKDSFEVTLTVYRDCSGVALAPPTLKVSCRSGNKAYVKENKLIDTSFSKDVTRKCENSCSVCDSSGCGLFYGTEEYEYTYLVHFDSNACNQVNFYFLESARSNSITTGPEGNFYVNAWVDRSLINSDKGPKFSQLPIRRLCKNKYLTFNQGGNDPDGDSLSYELTPPLNDSNKTVTYDYPYSYLNPLEWEGFQQVSRDLYPPYGFHVDSSYGTIAFKPKKTQVTVLALKVNVYRNDTLIGQTRRDMQIAIQDCNQNDRPYINSNLDLGTPNQICLGDTLKADFVVTDLDNDSIVSLSNHIKLPASADFSTSYYKDSATATITWAIPDSFAGQRFKLGLKAKDDGCPLPRRDTRVHDIHVAYPLKGYIEKQKLGCGLVSLKFKDTTGYSTSFERQFKWETYNWSKQGDSIQQYMQPGKTVVKLTTNHEGCKQIYYDTIQIDSNTLAADLGADTNICKWGSVTMNPTIKNSQGPVQYDWSTGENSQQITIENIANDTSVALTVSDTTGCSFTDQINIPTKSYPYSAKPFDYFNDGAYCLNDDTITAYSKGRGDYRVWSNQSTADTMLITKGGMYHITIYDSTTGCSYTDSFEITNTLPENFLSDTVAFCGKDSLTINSKAAYQGLWNTGDTAKQITVDTPGTYWANVYGPGGCNDSDTVEVVSGSKPGLTVSASSDSLCSGDTVTLTASSNGANISWNTSNSDSIIQVTTGGQYIAKATNSKGCKRQDTIAITEIKDCVWPGDANNDKAVDNTDILAIGQKHGITGSQRTNTGIQWSGYMATDWPDTFNSGLNTKFADANGDGTVNDKDTLAVDQNYSKTRHKKGLDGKQKKNGPALRFEIVQDTLNPGASFEAELKIGASDNEVNNLYAMALNFSHNGGKQDGYLKLQASDDWFFANSPALVFQKAFDQSQLIEAAFSRTNQQNISGHGKIGVIKGQINANLDPETTPYFHLDITGAKLIDQTGQEVAFNLSTTDSVFIQKEGSTVGDQSIKKVIEVYPNPAKNKLFIEWNGSQSQKARLLNPQGKVAKAIFLKEGLNDFPVKDLASGLYTLTIQSEKGVYTKRIMVP